MNASLLLLTLLGVFLTVQGITIEELSPLVNLKAEFERFKTQYGRAYTSVTEEQERFQIFSDNLVKAMNLNEAEGDGGAVFGVTKFMDLSEQEFRAYKGYVPAARRGVPTLQSMTASEYVASPCTATSCDWRKAGAVTPVKNQGQCGSCWAFSAIEGLESGWFLGGNTLVALSPQQVVSCDKVDGACNGGDLPTAYAYIKQAGGLETNAAYPYTSGGGSESKCAFNASKIVATLSAWSYAIPPCHDACTKQNEANLQKAVAAYGPSSICVNANPWHFYS